MFIVISLSEWPLMANIILMIHLFFPSLYVTVLILVTLSFHVFLDKFGTPIIFH